jgi:hypothetical protein
MLELETLVKTSQFIFYSTATVLTVLTYWSAKRGLLNTVNTEYQKEVIKKLIEVSNRLVEEFSPDSPRCWYKQRPVREAVEAINKEFANNRKMILQGEEPGMWLGIPMTKQEHELFIFLQSIKSDPLIPKYIRNALVEFLSGRLDVIRSIYHEELDSYKKQLADGKHTDTLEENWGWVHNQINDKLYSQGCGVSQIEQEIDELRIAIQEYLERFNPLRFRMRDLPKRFRQ